MSMREALSGIYILLAILIFGDAMNHFKHEAEQYLSGVQEKLTQAGLKVSSQVLSGNAADEIIRYANENHPNLVIMATHGSSGARRWEYGNIADKVLRGISSPVFLVRPQ